MSASAERRGPPLHPDAVRAVETPHRVLLIALTMVATIMTILDTTIANVALPHMEASLGATQETIVWVLTSYVLASAVALPISGWIVDRFGLRAVFLCSVLGFTVASVMCGMSQNLTQIVLFRAIQGIAGAFIAPLGQTLMMNVSSRDERPRMMVIYSQVVMIGPIVGPVLGGYLTENWNWRLVFLVNVPIGALCMIGLFAVTPHFERHKRDFDLQGWVYVALAMAAFQLMLDRGPSKDWFGSSEIVIYAVLCASCAWLAVIHHITARRPLFSAELFSDRYLVTALFLYMVVSMVAISVLALLPGLFQSLWGFPVILSGWLLASRGVGVLGAIALFGRWSARVDPRIQLSTGFSVSGLSFLLMSRWPTDTTIAQIVSASFLQGVGLSFTFIPLNLIAFATLPVRLRTDGAGLMNIFRNLGSSMGIGLATLMVARSIQVNHAEIGATITRLSAPADLDRVAAFGNIGPAALSAVDGMVNLQAAMIAYNNVFLAMGLACFAIIPLPFLLKKVDARGGVASEAASAH